MTLILGALDGEIAAAVDGLENATIESWHSYRFHRGTIERHDVLVARTGVGKSLAAMLCQHLIDKLQPERIVFTGVAGGLNPELDIGDTVVARDCLIHDMDVTSLGFARGEIPYTPYHAIPCDPDLVSRAAAISPMNGKLQVGRILTGDQFISSPLVRDELRETLGGDAVEMEGASVGLVATVNQVPFVLIRTISDKADGTAPGNFNEFLKFASRNSWHYLRQIVTEC